MVDFCIFLCTFDLTLKGSNSCTELNSKQSKAFVAIVTNNQKVIEIKIITTIVNRLSSLVIIITHLLSK